jgi:lipopolysaccharide/colanic/teichoic acid biosynthesis glycosyltransferase
MRRICDIIFSAAFCIILLPFLIPVMIILLLTGEHLVFYTQSRVGMGGKEFPLFKFVTMMKNSPSLGTGDITVKNDPRVLPFGKFLRSAKINELPQLLNILFGHMSFVGPRPLTPKNFNYYSKDEKLVIASMRPGLTGMASIFFRDEEGILDRFAKSVDKTVFYKSVIIPYKAELERWYAQRQSLWMYWKIIFTTAFAVAHFPSRLYLPWFQDLPVPPAGLRDSR